MIKSVKPITKKKQLFSRYFEQEVKLNDWASEQQGQLISSVIAEVNSVKLGLPEIKKLNKA